MSSRNIDIPDNDSLAPLDAYSELLSARIERQAASFIHSVAARLSDDYLFLLLSKMSFEGAGEEEVRRAVNLLRSPLTSPPALEWTPYDSLYNVLYDESTTRLFGEQQASVMGVNDALVFRSLLASSILLTEMKRGNDWKEAWGGVLAVFVQAATIADEPLAVGAMQFLQWALHDSQPIESLTPDVYDGWITLCRVAYTMIAANLASRGSEIVSKMMKSEHARYQLVELPSLVTDSSGPWSVLLDRCGEEIGNLSSSLSALRDWILSENNRRSGSDEHDPRGG